MRLESSIKRYIGLSTERKPRPGLTMEDGVVVTLSDLPAGSSFFEEDTGLVSRWTGLVWTEGFPEVRSEELQIQIEILSELRAARTEARTGLPVHTNSLR